MSKPTYNMIKSAFEPGDTIYVLNDGVHYKPTKVLSIGRKAFQTEVGEILYEDHGWLWRCFEQKGGAADENA